MKLKRTAVVVSALCIMCTAMPFTENIVPQDIVLSANADGDEITDGTLTYTKYTDHIEVTKCDTNAVEVEIPNQIDGLPVTVIGTKAFYQCSFLKKVTIPDNIIIMSYAFARCTRLTSFTVPDTAYCMGVNIFSRCTNLVSVHLPEKMQKIPNAMFEACEKLETVNFPETLTEIGEYAFCGCALASVTVPESVTKIGTLAFYMCPNLETVTILNDECILDGLGVGTFSSAVIYAHEGSTAQAFAKSNSYQFSALPEETSDNITYMEENQIMLDFNRDGRIDSADAALLLKFSAQMGSGVVSGLKEFCENNNLLA
ncbi:MAG: leucine-rich repeat protein [Oscillospiraceae bacterium]|nr:leucine-rich repeat protein [Oscillospiraceae bacterium]